MPQRRTHNGIDYDKHFRGDRGKYKYVLAVPYEYETDYAGTDGGNPFVRLHPDGRLAIAQEYAWDGPSGPAIDTNNFMRGSLVHDALYQLMRERVLDYKSDREHADRILRDIVREDGMSRLRAWWVYRSLRWFGEKAARPTPRD